MLSLWFTLSFCHTMKVCLHFTTKITRISDEDQCCTMYSIVLYKTIHIHHDILKEVSSRKFYCCFLSLTPLREEIILMAILMNTIQSIWKIYFRFKLKFMTSYSVIQYGQNFTVCTSIGKTLTHNKHIQNWWTIRRYTIHIYLQFKSLEIRFNNFFWSHNTN